ncbi:HepT-like ribonuclease domain-containing protein [Leptothoe spongobia]|uniref:DUF86 domain-containing protein n=1 Tax=Leptothoe spongobia TAU-MAC 1115 TaxID=1967444 RepID=A0A947DAT0_9CYAN|nr:DUF86 domain-containing protein [Leptothoe spongobia]MBT9314000.1 DUF86 domain-containing protein [Leptothoe spongobia TAU-MAC 1115]
MTQRDIRDYLQDILNHIAAAERFINGMTFDDFQSDEKTIFALIRALEVIGEAIKQIPPSLTEQYPDIPWRGFAGMRDKLIHVYFGVKLEILWNTAQQDLPQLQPVIQAMLAQLENED